MFRSDSIRGVLVVVATAACSHSDTLHPRPTKAQIIAECSGGSGNEVRLANGVDGDAPALVLEENNYHGVQPAQPTLAIWSDGRVLFGHSLPNDGPRPKFELLQGRIPTSTVNRLIEDVAKELVTAPRHTDAHGAYVVSGGQSTTITVHAGDRWISASVYDAYEEDFLAAAAGPRVEKKSEQRSPATSESEIDTSAFLPSSKPVPPPAFSRAYKRILEARPDRGVPYVPYDFGLTFFGPDRQTMRQPQMAWPHDLPPVPLNIDPDACSPYRTDGCSYILDEKYRSAALRLRVSLRANKVWPYFELNGKRFSVRVDDFYRGERSIKAISTCSHDLVVRAK